LRRRPRPKLGCGAKERRRRTKSLFTPFHAFFLTFEKQQQKILSSESEESWWS
jgi:hypothetical protein